MLPKKGGLVRRILFQQPCNTRATHFLCFCTCSPSTPSRHSLYISSKIQTQHDEGKNLTLVLMLSYKYKMMQPKRDISSGQKNIKDNIKLGLKLFKCALHSQHKTRQNTTCTTNEKSNGKHTSILVETEGERESERRRGCPYSSSLACVSLANSLF